VAKTPHEFTIDHYFTKSALKPEKLVLWDGFLYKNFMEVYSNIIKIITKKNIVILFNKLLRWH
jgi:hypothetical protein